MERGRTSFETSGLWQDGRNVTKSLESCRAVALSRRFHPDGSVSLQALLTGHGVQWLRLPGAAKGTLRFGGSIEPLVWGIYSLRHSPRAIYLNEVEVKDDLWALRKNPKALLAGLSWAKLLARHLVGGFDHDEVMKIFYWALKSLEQGLTPQWATARFLWRWLDYWGMAPDFSSDEQSSGAPYPPRQLDQVVEFLSLGTVDEELIRGIEAGPLVTLLKGLLHEGA